MPTPATSTPPPATPTAPPASSTAPEDALVEDDGGAGALGWSAALLLPLLARRRSRAR
jgi:hypothetical protein